jgi:DNA-binding MarR family transcriptional regulator
MATTPTRPTQAEVSSLEDHLGFWLRFVSNHVSYAFAAKVQKTGVTVAEWVILREIYGRDGIAPSDLAEATGLTRGAISKLVDRLLAKKLLSRTYSEEDRRYQSLFLTTGGKRLVPTLAALADQNDVEFFAALTIKERAALLATLQKIAQANNLRAIPVD